MQKESVVLYSRWEVLSKLMIDLEQDRTKFEQETSSPRRRIVNHSSVTFGIRLLKG